jgi:hypothetical protein
MTPRSPAKGRRSKRPGLSVFSGGCIHAVVVAWVAFGCPERGRADPAAAIPAAEATTRRIVVEGQSAWNAPLGEYGLAVDADLLSLFTAPGPARANVSLAVSGGVGMDIFNDTEVGLRWAVMPRLRLALGGAAAFSLAAGTGISSGKNQAYPSGSTRIDGELSLEHGWRGGLRARAFGGAGFVVDATGGQARSPRHLYMGFGLGYAFSPNPELPPAESASIGRWYGWQTLAFDVFAAGIPIVTDRIHDGDGGINPTDFLGHRHLANRAAIALFVTSGPSVHVAHRSYKSAIISAGARLLVPLGLGLLGSTVHTGDGGGDLMVEGAVAGAGLAAVFDAVVLGWDAKQAGD